MKQIISFVRYIALFFVAMFLTPYSYIPVANFYRNTLGASGGFDIDFTDAGVAFFVLEALFALLLIFFGERARYRNHILIIVLFLFVAGVLLDPTHFYFPIGLIILGSGLGWVLRFVCSNTLGKMPALEPYKKYF
ncbi:MAG: hypothetical protein UY74_C0043G0020 [Candidatus Kaiserbacteria bacterium GW2011_GWC2_52_8b]|uniref:Uncharacterized protein n=2 Tax=Candidatus Kaiseribacteriota TaxID=1752734 RepID=A0A0G1XHE0_9BACT|nr:MAG: hypothetical protein UY67_C0024G0019 [Candidatus Kaiserbacteria bacterium GW2011_GWA2_52_12]KKW30376.1 MAG: hypothetical protein UY74_C0043G0020 [Candidatus Kaiserbacteria bacterium GW2011_GWC2_52_8b]